MESAYFFVVISFFIEIVLSLIVYAATIFCVKRELKILKKLIFPLIGLTFLLGFLNSYFSLNWATAYHIGLDWLFVSLVSLLLPLFLCIFLRKHKSYLY